MRKPDKVVTGMTALLFLTAPAFANIFSVQCDRERYYEGESISCGTCAPGDYIFSWSILGKELQRNEMHVLGCLDQPQVMFKAPSTLRAITPLTLEVIGYKQMKIEKEFQLYPRDPGFYLNPGLLEGKRVAVDDPTGKLKKELDYLKIPYDSVRMADMPPKRYDLFIVARSTPTAEPVIANNGAPVIQLDVSTHLDNDPETRWLLAQRIRAVFKQQNEAKDLATTRSNP